MDSQTEYNFQKPGLEMGVENRTFFCLKWGLDLYNRAAHPHKEFRGVNPGPGLKQY